MRIIGDGELAKRSNVEYPSSGNEEVRQRNSHPSDEHRPSDGSGNRRKRKEIDAGKGFRNRMVQPNVASQIENGRRSQRRENSGNPRSIQGIFGEIPRHGGVRYRESKASDRRSGRGVEEAASLPVQMPFPPIGHGHFFRGRENLFGSKIGNDIRLEIFTPSGIFRQSPNAFPYGVGNPLRAGNFRLGESRFMDGVRFDSFFHGHSVSDFSF